MTPRELKVLTFISAFTIEKGYSPSYREITAALDLKSKSGVSAAVQTLIADGYLRRKNDGSHQLEVLHLPQLTKACPCCGRAAA